MKSCILRNPRKSCEILGLPCEILGLLLVVPRSRSVARPGWPRWSLQTRARPVGGGSPAGGGPCRGGPVGPQEGEEKELTKPWFL